MAARRRVTSVDVAKEAGVSQTTVSYVLNDVPHQKISEETRRRVLAAVDRLGYTPSAAARSLRRGRNDIVLLWSRNLPVGPTMAGLIEHLTDALEVHGLTVVTRLERDRPIAASWRELNPAAVVLFTDLGPGDREQMEAAGTRVVHNWLDGSGHDDFTRSQTHVGRTQARHLIGTGRTRLGYAAPGDARLLDFFELRLRGVRQECERQGVAAPDVREVPLEADAAAEAVLGWHAAGVTGVCAYNDELAFALLAGVRRAGLAVPGDLAVIGVDDIPLAGLAVPPLTTIRQDMAVLAGHLARRVLVALGGDAAAPEPASMARLVVRESA